MITLLVIKLSKRTGKTKARIMDSKEANREQRREGARDDAMSASSSAAISVIVNKKMKTQLAGLLNDAYKPKTKSNPPCRVAVEEPEEASVSVLARWYKKSRTTHCQKEKPASIP